MKTLNNTFVVPLIHLNETLSTNSYLEELSSKKDVEEFTTVLADYQTAGRGQRGNHWEADAGQNLLFSFVLYPKFVASEHQFIVSQIAALALKESLDIYDEGFSIKWSNDLYWHDKKISGMLIENSLIDGYMSKCIVGIGLNVNQKKFCSDAPNPVSLYQIIGKTVDRIQLLNDIMSRMRGYYTLLQKGDNDTIRARYAQSLYRKKGTFRYEDANGLFEATFADVCNDGTYVLCDTEGNKRRYLFKEIKFVID